MPFWSCRLNRPETLKKHRLESAAIKKAGEFGLIYDSEEKKVYQIFIMANGKFKKFDIVKQAKDCYTADFDMIKLLKEKGIEA